MNRDERRAEAYAMAYELHKRTGNGVGACLGFLELADFDMELAYKIGEYECLAVNWGCPVGHVIREYWTAKAKEATS